MAGGAPGSSSRGRGGKFKKYTRGGGHHFSRNLQPIDADGNAVSMWGAEDPTKNGEDSSEEEDDDDEEEDSDDEDGTSAAKEEASREARKAQKKARKEAAIAKAKGKTIEVGDMPTSDEEEDEDDDDDMPANPNHSKAARKQAKAPTAAAADVDADVDEVTDGVNKLQAGNRKEREALEAAAAKERYLKMQAQGKTDEAKADLARLKVIREQRAAEAARRQAEKEEREAQEKEKRAQIEAREAKKREAAAGPKKGSKKK